MNSRTRFLTGSLASVAIASAVTLATPSAYAADAPTRPCGLPAVPAVYTTLVTEPQLRTVPAVTHQEWRWQRDVTTWEHEFTTVVTAAHTESDWTRTVPGRTEYQWAHGVVDVAAAPAVPGIPAQGHWETVVITPAVPLTMFEYVQQQTGKLRWEPAGWNGDKGDEDKGQGWTKTGNTRDDGTPAVTDQKWVEDQPAVPGTPAVNEVSHLEYVWAATSPGADWSGPLDSRTTGGGTESATTSGDQPPAGDGWTKLETRTIPEVTDTVWADVAPDGYTATGRSRVKDVTTEETDATSATAPDGDGWTADADSVVTVTDQEASTELVGGSSEQVLVSAEVPASAPCPDAPQGSVAGPRAPGTSEVSGVHAAAAAQAGTVLPDTGNPISPLLAATGLGAVLAGSVLVQIGRRRTAR